MHTRRQILSLAAPLCLLFSSSASQAEDVTLSFWLSGPEYQQVMEEQIKRFEEVNPGIKVELNTLDWSSNRQQLLSGLATGTPDVISFFSPEFPGYVEQGFLLDISDRINKDDWQASALAVMTYGGKVRALPWGMTARALVYREDLLAEAGLTGAPKTWDDLRNYAEKLTKRDASGHLERSGLYLPVNHSYKTPGIFITYLRNNGGDVLSADGKHAAFNSPEGVEAAQFLADLYKKSKVDEAGAITNPSDFLTGRYVMAIDSGSVVGIIQAEAQEMTPKVKVAVPPYKKVPVVEIAVEAVAVAASSKHPEEAIKLALFLTSEAKAVAAHDETGAYIPATKAGLDSEYARTSAWIPQFREFIQYGRALPVHPRYAEIEAIIKDAMERILTTDADVKSTLDEAVAQVDSLLKQ